MNKEKHEAKAEILNNVTDLVDSKSSHFLCKVHLKINKIKQTSYQTSKCCLFRQLFI